MKVSLVSPVAARAVTLGALVLALEWSRALAARDAGAGLVVVMAIGGALLCATALGFSPATLGLGWDRLPVRVLGAAALTAVLLLPAAVRWGGAPPLAGGLALAAIVIAIGEELAFRGALYSELEGWLGPLPAVAGTSALFAAGHVMSHPVQFLPAVFGAGLVLGLWRWACRDLIAPVVAHSLADLAL